MGIEELRRRVRDICESEKVVRLDLFGSRARASGVEESDYDFAAEFPEFTAADYSQHYFGLLHALEDELHSSVDLINYNTISKPSLRRNIERERIAIYER